MTLDITLNGCMCHLLPTGTICISCRGREKGLENGDKCKRCSKGILAGEGSDPMFPRPDWGADLCSQCFYDKEDGKW